MPVKLPEGSEPKNVEKLISKITEKSQNGEYLFRGMSNEHHKVNSSLYRKHEDIFKANKSFIPHDLQEDIIDAARQNFAPEGTQKNVILTELQHYGGLTNLIDFTYDLHVALFFACNGDFDKNGKVIIFPNKSTLEEEISPVDPAMSPVSQGRVSAQSSIFVMSRKGYIDKEHYQEEIIESGIKLATLDYLQKYGNRSTRTLFGDLQGFIAHEEDFDEARTEFCKGMSARKANRPREAIKHYSEAIKLDPNYANAYFDRGLTNHLVGKSAVAIPDFDKAIALSPKHAMAHYYRARCNHRRGNYKEAISDYDRSLKLGLPSLLTSSAKGLLGELTSDKRAEITPKIGFERYRRRRLLDRWGKPTPTQKDARRYLEEWKSRGKL